MIMKCVNFNRLNKSHYTDIITCMKEDNPGQTSEKGNNSDSSHPVQY